MTASTLPPTLLVAAPRSGSGKTAITAGLLRAIRRRGLRVAAAKAGPDYIDPGFHAAASGRPCLNLDSWAMPPALLDALMRDAGRDADLLLIESAMGLFDGVPGAPGRTGAAADLARRWSMPVLLVLDVSGQSQTAGAVARGLALHDAGVRVAGVILNRVGSERHRRLVEDGFAGTGLAILGAIPRGPAFHLPERHLGLVQAEETGAIEAMIERLAAGIARALDLDAILRLAAPPTLPTEDDAMGDDTAGSDADVSLPPPGNRIAVGRDAAFSFLYPHLVDGWRQAGATLHPFSPLADEQPPPDCDCCWLPGGYPELHAGRLAAASHFLNGLRRFAATRPVHGECGGFMVMGRALIDADGTAHPMAGLLSHTTSFATRALHLGYREARLLADGPLGPEDARIRGHEFHHSTLVEPGDDAPFAKMTAAEGQSLGPGGARRGFVTGTWFHAVARAG